MGILTFLLGRKALGRVVDSTTADTQQLPRRAPVVVEEDDTASLQALARDDDGYVRHAAVIRCVQLARSDLLPIIASRLNDWVLQIRQAARSGVETLVPLLPAPAVLDILPAVAHLRTATREDHGAWIERFERAVCEHVPADTLVESARHGSNKTARACFRLLKTYSLVDSVTLVRLGLKRRDDIGIVLEALYLCAALDDDDRVANYLQALDSHFGAARAHAIRALLQDRAVQDKAGIATAALMNKGPNVRDAAIYYLKQAGMDPAAVYRDVIRDAASSERVAIALAALGSCRSAVDLELVRDHVQSASPSVRAAALFAWLRIAPAAKDNIAAHALEDASPRVRRLARIVVNRHKAYVPRASIMAAIARTQDFKLLSMLSTDTVWDLLEVMARVPVVPETMSVEVADRLQSPFLSKPGADQLTLIRSARDPLLQKHAVSNPILMAYLAAY